MSGCVTERGEIRCSSVVLAGGAWSRLFAGNMASISGPEDPRQRRPRLLGRAVFPILPLVQATRLPPPSGWRVRCRPAQREHRPDHAGQFPLICDYTPTLIKSWNELTLRIGRPVRSRSEMARSWRRRRGYAFEQVRILDPDPSSGGSPWQHHPSVEAFPSFRDANPANVGWPHGCHAGCCSCYCAGRPSSGLLSGDRLLAMVSVSALAPAP